jgi:hypothetical protein
MPRLGYKQSDDHKKKKSEAAKGKKNSQYKDGNRSYRTVMGCCVGDGKVVNHKDGNRSRNTKDNLQVLNDPPKKGSKRAGRRTTTAHERMHKRR